MDSSRGARAAEERLRTLRNDPAARAELELKVAGYKQKARGEPAAPQLWPQYIGHPLFSSNGLAVLPDHYHQTPQCKHAAPVQELLQP